MRLQWMVSFRVLLERLAPTVMCTSAAQSCASHAHMRIPLYADINTNTKARWSINKKKIAGLKSTNRQKGREVQAKMPTPTPTPSHLTVLCCKHMHTVTKRGGVADPAHVMPACLHSKQRGTSPLHHPTVTSNVHLLYAHPHTRPQHDAV